MANHINIGQLSLNVITTINLHSTQVISFYCSFIPEDQWSYKRSPDLDSFSCRGAKALIKVVFFFLLLLLLFVCLFFFFVFFFK